LQAAIITVNVPSDIRVSLE